MGLVWLEGSDASALGVRAAAWNGTGFSAAEWVSPPLDGSQLALSGAVLADGSWLLAWSAFDGSDDEILWSRRDGATWTAPARLHPDNRVPDITPAVAATARGAVAAWSRYDGGSYRGRVMRFDASAGWRDEERLGGAGSVFPFFAVDDSASGPLLVFREGVEGRWDLIELGGRGEVRSRTQWTGDPSGGRWCGSAPVERRAWSGSPAVRRTVERTLSRRDARRVLAAGCLALLGAPAPRRPQSPTIYVAFGDSVTEGVGDEEGGGYPPRLEALLVARGRNADVRNRGVSGETTVDGLARIDSVLAQGGDVLLLMEGTNDLPHNVSPETVAFNLDEMAKRAERAGMDVVVASVIPRSPVANVDRENILTQQLAETIRDLGGTSERELADPFEEFITTPNLYQDFYSQDPTIRSGTPTPGATTSWPASSST